MKGLSMAKLKTFSVDAAIGVWCGTEIKAASLEDAVAQSKNLKFGDFLSGDDITDYNMHIIQVYDPNFSIDVVKE